MTIQFTLHTLVLRTYVNYAYVKNVSKNIFVIFYMGGGQYLVLLQLSCPAYIIVYRFSLLFYQENKMIDRYDRWLHNRMI